MHKKNNEIIENKKIIWGIKLFFSIIILYFLYNIKNTFLFSFPLTLALFYTIFKIEKMYLKYKQTEKKQGFWYTIYFSVSLILLYNPLKESETKIIKFNRVIGAGIIENFDISRIIKNFSSWFLIFLTIFTLFFLLINYLKSKKLSKENKRVIDFLDNFVILANISLLFRCINYFYNNSQSYNIFYYSQHIEILIIITTLIYIFFNLEKNFSSDLYTKLIIVLFSISYPISIFIYKKIPFELVLLIVQSGIVIFSILVIKLSYKLFEKINLNLIITSGAVILVLFPLMTAAYMEMINIFNQWEIFVSNPKKYYILVSFFLFIIFLISIFIIKKKNWQFNNWKKWTYPLFLLGVSCLSVQLSLQSVYKLDFFEGANYSVLISDFFNFGSFPIIEHYGGHMMTDVWEGIIYGILNNDLEGAIFSPYSVYFSVVLSILFFYFIKNIWNQEMALLATLLFPFYQFWNYFGLGILICLAMSSYIKKSTYTRAILLWGIFVWCALYRLDIGYSFGLAVFLTMFIYIILEKDWSCIKSFILPLIGWGAACGIIWFIICVMKDINPKTRLMEFLKISLSNQNWAYASIGNIEMLVFSWVYMIIPFVMLICIIYLIFSEKFRKEIKKEKWILLLVLGISYFTNFSRGLVRHSLVENITYVAIWTAYIFLATFFSYFKKNKKLFLPIFTGLILLNTLLLQIKNFSEYSIIDNSNTKIEEIIGTWINTEKNGKTVWKQLKEEKRTVNRVIWDDELKRGIEPYRIIIETLLNKDETFVDFINKTILYSILNKKSPVYISQSPLQLSGEFTQEEFINQIKGVPIVLMPSNSNSNYRALFSLDGISNNYRNYKVAEYIYQNYVPLLKYEDIFSVWCLKEHYDEMKNKSKSLIYEKNYTEEFFNADSLRLHNVELNKNNNKLEIKSIGIDPFVDGLHNFIELKKYIGNNVKLTIDYNSDVIGDMQLFYTTDKDEKFSSKKVITTQIFKSGITEFTIPVTEFTRIRLDIPEGSNVTIFSLKVESPVSYIDYGYDGPYEKINKNRNKEYSYLHSFHNYNIKFLPFIWANYDIKKAINNKVLLNLTKKDEIFIFRDNIIISKEKGNYLLTSLTYIKTGTNDGNDKRANAVIKLGNYKNGIFEEKYKYTINIEEGKQDYLIRVSSDYYWYTGQINAVQLKSESKLENVTMKILEGD